MNAVLRTVKHWLGWILRPGLAYRRIRESRWAGSTGIVRNDLPVDSLPNLNLVLAETPSQREEIVGIYQRCPSELVIAPRSMAKLKELIGKNREFYLVQNAAGETVGAVGWIIDRDMMAYLAVEYRFRRGGVGLATTKALQDLKRDQGVRRVYSQVLRKNSRYLSTAMSLGYRIDETQSTEDYYTIYLDLDPAGEE